VAVRRAFRRRATQVVEASQIERACIDTAWASVSQDPATVHELRPEGADMLEYVFRFNVEKGKQNEFIDWLRANEDDLKTHTRPGWTYIGTLMTVGGFGDYDGESRWALESYASLGEGWGDDVAQRLLGEFFALIETKRDVSLLRNVATVQSAPNL
jgi:hypothetical protein